MKLFHGSRTSKKLSGVLTHFGSMLASAQRLESVFATKNHAAYSGGEDMVLLDFNNEPIGVKAIAELTQNFSTYAQQTVISQFSLQINSSLRLSDFWGDDPIASGGAQIISKDNQLSNKQKKNWQKYLAHLPHLFIMNILIFLKHQTN